MKESKKYKEAYIFILPALIYLAVVVGYPICYNIVLSFKDVDVKNFAKGTSTFVGFKNYMELFGDDTFCLILKNTIVYTLACLAFQFTIGFALAMFFAKRFRFAAPIRGVMLIPWMMPMAVTAMLGKNIFSNTGLINDLLLKIGIISKGVEWLTAIDKALPAVIAMNCWVGIPFNMLLLTSGLCNISQDVYESSAIDGANAFQRFVFITIPLMKNAMLSVLMLGFIYTFKAFDLMYIMTAGGPLNATDVLGTYAYLLSFTQYQFSKGAAVAVVLLLCLLCIGVFYLYLIMKEDD